MYMLWAINVVFESQIQWKGMILFSRIKGSSLWLLFTYQLLMQRKRGTGCWVKELWRQSAWDQPSTWSRAWRTQPLWGQSLGTSVALLSSVGGSCFLPAFYSSLFSLYNALCQVHKTFSIESWENNAKEMVETCVWTANALSQSFTHLKLVWRNQSD